MAPTPLLRFVLLALCLALPGWMAQVCADDMTLDMGTGDQSFEGVAIQGARYTKEEGLVFNIAMAEGGEAHPVEAKRIRSLTFGASGEGKTYDLVLLQKGERKVHKGVTLTKLEGETLHVRPAGQSQAFPVPSASVIQIVVPAVGGGGGFFGDGGSGGVADPFTGMGGAPAPGGDPFGPPAGGGMSDPFGPAAGGASSDPFGPPAGGGMTDPFGPPGGDPFGPPAAASSDPFGDIAAAADAGNPGAIDDAFGSAATEGFGDFAVDESGEVDEFSDEYYYDSEISDAEMGAALAVTGLFAVLLIGYFLMVLVTWIWLIVYNIMQGDITAVILLFICGWAKYVYAVRYDGGAKIFLQIMIIAEIVGAVAFAIFAVVTGAL